jgi:hypothetical protein
MAEDNLPELTGIAVELIAGGKTSKVTGTLLGAAAMILETSRREPLRAEVELRFQPSPASPEIVAQGVVDGHVGDKGLRIHFTEIAEKHRRHLLELLYPPGADRRTARRASLATQIRTILDEETLVGYTRDISTGGVFVEAENPPAKGTEVNLRFKLGADSPILGARAVVAYVLPNEGMGLRFVDLAPEIGQAIEEFVQQREDS